MYCRSCSSKVAKMAGMMTRTGDWRHNVGIDYLEVTGHCKDFDLCSE